MCIQDKAMLISIKFSMIGMSKKDPAVTEATNNNNHAQTDAGRYTKNLYSNEALKPIRAARDYIRTLWIESSSPWGDNGFRIMPSTLYNTFTSDYRKAKADWDAEITLFIQRRQAWLDEAKVRLGDMYDEDLYPTEEEMNEHFDVSVEVMAIPDGEDFRIESMDADTIKQQINDNVSERTQKITTDLFARLYKVVKSMSDRLAIVADDDGTSKRRKSFQNTLIGNIEDLVSVLPDLNLNKDPELDRLTQEIKDRLLIDPSIIRDNPTTLKRVQQDAEKIADDMSFMFSS
jgi:hypothetical protein